MCGIMHTILIGTLYSLHYITYNSTIFVSLKVIDKIVHFKKMENVFPGTMMRATLIYNKLFQAYTNFMEYK